MAPNTEPSGVLRFNAPVAFGQRQIVPILHHCQRRYPAIKAELMLTDQLTDPVRDGIRRTGSDTRSVGMRGHAGQARYPRALCAAAVTYAQGERFSGSSV
ncbi:hypothetical protein [Halomonas sp. SpR8]|uniref:hypothetical protein n=1 Tax=Halomonas sp. SpR8 TaxID=3050463 RepID=UPI0027E4E95C|nr:hypothetical protein [Halomonas sp. SpR8]MDQ7728270.1 hypothetical protein [Halomonas sp. SpR8]